MRAVCGPVASPLVPEDEPTSTTSALNDSPGLPEGCQVVSRHVDVPLGVGHYRGIPESRRR